MHSTNRSGAGLRPSTWHGMAALLLCAGALACGPASAQATGNQRPAAAKPAAGKARPSPVKPRRRVRPAAGQASARPVPVPDASDAATARAYRQDAARHRSIEPRL